MALSTAPVCVAQARRFLACCAPGGELGTLTASDVTGAVLRASASVSANTTKLFVTALRSFLRFSFIEGLTPSDLSPAAVSVARRHQIRHCRWGSSRRLCQCACLVLATGGSRRVRRDYGVLLMLAPPRAAGWRGGRPARLEDIDWREPGRGHGPWQGTSTKTVSHCTERRR